MIRQLIAVCTVLSVVLTGCSRQGEPEETVPPLTVLFQDVRASMDAGNIQQAIALLDEAYADDEFAGDRSQILNALLSLRLSNDMTDEAVAIFTAAAQESPQVAEYSLGSVAGALRNQLEPAALLDWTSSLLDVPFSDAIVPRVYVHHSHALLINGRADAVLELVPLCREKFGTAACLDIYRGMITSSAALAERDVTAKIIEAIQSSANGEPVIVELADLSRLDWLASGGKLEEFVTLLAEKIGGLSGNGASVALSRAMRATAGETNRDIRERLCVMVIDSRKADEPCVSAASRHWLNSAAENDPASVHSRTKHLLEKGLAPNRILRFLPNAFYAVLNMEDPEKLTEMVALAKSIRPLLTEERDLTTINSMLLDGSFILNDSSTAIEMVEQGVPGRDEDWHKSALAKLKAHRALDGGNTEEAVKYFREFMGIIAETMDREVDPSSGMTYTANWCLGRNAKRIGDILKAAGEEDRSVAAYKEARGLFEKALADFSEDSRETGAITREMAEIP